MTAMGEPTPDAASVAAAVADAHRREWAYVLAATVRVTRDLDLAEECVQDAYAKALTDWAAGGIPGKPAAWLTQVARRRALDLHRRDTTLRTKLPLLVDDRVDDRLGDRAAPDTDAEPDEIGDDRLRLIFTCCHPGLAPEARVALTLRLLCGLSTAEVARAFLVSEATMAARITRAKKKIAAAGIPYRVPPAEELPERVDAVLTVVHLVFTTGHTMAAIAAVHAQAPSWAATDWQEIVGLYDLLVRIWPSPVVALNRAVAVGFAFGPAEGLAALDALATEPQLAGYAYLPSARAEFLRRLGRLAEARTSYTEALLLTENAAEREFLTDRLAGLPD
jgi:RNA polymerase sigma factor (sigma-70 family)